MMLEMVSVISPSHTHIRGLPSGVSMSRVLASSCVFDHEIRPISNEIPTLGDNCVLVVRFELGSCVLKE